MKKFPQDAQAFISYTSTKINLCSGCFYLQLVLLEKEDGTKIHSMLNIISKLNHGLNLFCLRSVINIYFGEMGMSAEQINTKNSLRFLFLPFGSFEVLL